MTNVEDLVNRLAAAGMMPLLNDEIWQCYGYNKRPQKGNIWFKMFPKKFKLEKLIEKELLTMGLIDVLTGIKKSTETPETKLLIAVGVIDKFLFGTKTWKIFFLPIFCF